MPLVRGCSCCKGTSSRRRVGRQRESRGAAEPGPLGFAAAEAAWREGAPWLDALLRHLHGNFLALASFLRERLPALRLAALEATYLAWIDATAAPAAAPGSAALARRLEREARVKLSPGSIYGEAPGTAHLRLNLATSRARLLEALDRIAPILGPAPDNPQPKCWHSSRFPPIGARLEVAPPEVPRWLSRMFGAASGGAASCRAVVQGGLQDGRGRPSPQSCAPPLPPPEPARVLANPLARRGKGSFPIIGKLFSNGWKIPPVFSNDWKNFSGGFPMIGKNFPPAPFHPGGSPLPVALVPSEFCRAAAVPPARCAPQPGGGLETDGMREGAGRGETQNRSLWVPVRTQVRTRRSDWTR